MSRYDYRDPALDPDYCNGLAADDDDERDLCAWCNDPMPAYAPNDPYCSRQCAAQADLDSTEDSE